MKSKTMIAMSVLVFAAASASADATIRFDPSTPAFKDQRDHRSGSSIG